MDEDRRNNFVFGSEVVWIAIEIGLMCVCFCCCCYCCFFIGFWLFLFDVFVDSNRSVRIFQLFDKYYNGVQLKIVLWWVVHLHLYIKVMFDLALTARRARRDQGLGSVSCVLDKWAFEGIFSCVFCIMLLCYHFCYVIKWMNWSKWSFENWWNYPHF